MEALAPIVSFEINLYLTSSFITISLLLIPDGWFVLVLYGMSSLLCCLLFLFGVTSMIAIEVVETVLFEFTDELLICACI
jgi:hypothetical protein